MILDFQDLNIGLYDGDTELQSGERHMISSITITEDNGFYLVMDNGENWCAEDLAEYERDLIIEEIADYFKCAFAQVH